MSPVPGSSGVRHRWWGREDPRTDDPGRVRAQEPCSAGACEWELAVGKAGAQVLGLSYVDRDEWTTGTRAP